MAPRLATLRLFSATPNSSDRRSEHIIKSTLKLVSKYDETTKLGLKVFHLQQISDCQSNDVMLSSDVRYLELKKLIFTPEAMKQLSVAQMVATFVSLGRLRGANKKEWGVLANALKGFCDSESSSISGSQICACLYWISKSGNSVCVRDRVLVSVFKRLLRDSNSWNAVDMGWLMYFLREKHRMDHAAWDRVVRQVAYRFNERLGQMSAKNISCILYEFSRNNLHPGRAIQRALRFADQRKTRLDSKSTALLLVALGKLGVYRSDFVESIARFAIEKKLVEQSRDNQLRTSVTMLYGLAKLDIFNQGLVRAVMERFMQESEENVSNTDLGMLAYSFGRLGLASNKSEWSKLAKIVNNRVDSLAPHTVTSIVVGMGKSGFVDEKILSNLRRVIIKDKRAYSGRQIVNLIHSFGILNQKLESIAVTGTDEERAVFQLNIAQLSGNLEHDVTFPIMKPIVSSRPHQNVYEFLKTNGFTDISLCQQIGSIWVDACFTDSDGTRHALVFTGDSDVCKLNSEELLGPMKWRMGYIERSGVKGICVKRKMASSLANLWDDSQLAHLVRTPRPVAVSTKRIAPIQIDHELGKISFR